jgi:hypothetical protein
VLLCEKKNGQCELRGLMKHDELVEIRCFYAHEFKKKIRNAIVNRYHILKITYRAYSKIEPII